MAELVRTAAPEQPFFLYIAHNAVHAPLQAKPADLHKYRGRYDAGWTALRAARYQRQLELEVIPPSARLALSDPMIPDWDQATPAGCRWQRETMRQCWTTRPPASVRAVGASSWTAGMPPAEATSHQR